MTKKKSDRNKVIGGMAWKFAERISSQTVTFVLSIILARLLSPTQYGVVAMMNVFVVIANVFVVGGFNTSLIQKKDADNIDYSTVYYCTLAMSIIMYSIMFIAAPYIAIYYEMPELTLLTRVFSLSLIIQSYQTVQQAYISSHMMFRFNFYATLIGTVFSGIVGVLMAYSGYGVWALVTQQLLAILINTLILRYCVNWHPQFIFSFNRAKALMSYGSKILGSTLINTIYKEIRQLLIGLYYTPADLALYNRGAHLPHLVTTNLDNSIRSVLFPAMAKYNDDLPRVKQMLRRSIQNSSYVTYFFLTLMAASSEPLIRILLTEKWIDCVPYMQILCISFMIQTVSVSNVQALKAIGKSGEVLKLELFKKPVFLLVIIAALPFGVKAIACTAPINALYALWTNVGPTQKHLNYGRFDQLKDLIPGFFAAFALAISVWPLTKLPINDYAMISLQVVIAIIVYWAISIIFKLEAYYYVKNTIIDLYNTKFRKHRTNGI